jgi:hypothetical protein
MTNGEFENGPVGPEDSGIRRTDDVRGQGTDAGLSNMEGVTLSYLTCPQDAGGAFLGAIMVTDYRTRPLHFSFVSPIRPTRMQRLLYGHTLDEHIRIDVVAYKLWKELPCKPTVLFVDVPELITARQVAGLPTALLCKEANSQLEPNKLTPLRYDTGQNIDDQETVGQILAKLEAAVDLVDPFTRMREALKEAVKSPHGPGE